MSQIQTWTLIFIVASFAVYLYIAWRSRVKETAGFYVAGQGIPTIANGAAVAADWMSAASFISMAGLIAFLGSDGTIYLMDRRLRAAGPVDRAVPAQVGQVHGSRVRR
jgi:cation/acetate symporter